MYEGSQGIINIFYIFFKFCISFSERSILFKQSVQTLMKFRIMYYFIWVFDVCKSTRILGNHERHSG